MAIRRLFFASEAETFPTLRTLLRHERAYIREGALTGLAGDQTEPDEPVGAAPRGFYDVRDWPADVGAIREEVLAEMERLLREDPHHAIRELAATRAEQIRTGDRYCDVPEVPALIAE